MSRFLTTKRIILALVLLFAACGLYGYLVADRLKREGVEARAVVTRVYSREETRTRGTARRPRYEKVTASRSTAATTRIVSAATTTS